MLAASGLFVWRGENLLLDNVDVELNAGEVLQVQGANGSGKTTLLRVLCGLVPVEDGAIFWYGKPLHRVRDEFQRALLYLGHKPGISGSLTPRENLTVFCALHGGSTEAIDAALEELALGERLQVPCGVLSAGQQRRVGLARLLLQPARLWVLDEPLTALDAGGLAWVRQQLRQHTQAGGAVMFTTHQTLPLDGFVSRTLELGLPSSAVA